jgi:carboxymethylenebutenolidase
MIERQVEIATKDGRMNTFICHPERAGPHPVVIFYMDAPGIREELRDMARRLGTVGYYVMLPNLYYRSNVEDLNTYAGGPDARAKAMALMVTIDIPKVMSDTDALIAFADTDPAARKGAMGCVGYCMSGKYAANAAARHPHRVRAAASFYGVELITDRPDSAHLAPQKTDARIYFGCAELDKFFPREMVEQLQAHLTTGGNAEVEIYAGVDHGFAFPLRAVYNKAAAERHWERIFELFAPLHSGS